MTKRLEWFKKDLKELIDNFLKNDSIPPTPKIFPSRRLLGFDA